jgi:hypothetical protein
MSTLIMAMLFAIIQTGQPVPRKAPDSVGGTRQSVTKKGSDNKAPTTSPSPVIKPIAPNPEQNASNPPKPKDEEQTVRIRELPSVSVRRDLPDWILWSFNGALVIVGFLGVRLAYKTLRAIEKQTKATEDAAIATQIAADATKRSVELQEVLNRQWIDIEDEKAEESVRYGPSGRETSVVISFAIVNNTKMPLTLRSVRFQIGKQHASSRTLEHSLAPDNGYPVDFPVPLNSAELLTRYSKHELVLVITGWVGYTDAFEKSREQPFGFTCRCGSPSYAVISPHPGLPQE